MKILGYNYKMRSVDCDLDAGNMGTCHTAKNTIIISTDYPDDRRISTVLHEILEALNFNLELELTHPVTTQLESGLFQVLTDAGVDLSPLLKELK
jgi:hypothetical protein